VVWSESGEKYAQIKHSLQAKIVHNSSKQTGACVDFDVTDNRRWTFSPEEALLWIIDSGMDHILMMDLFQFLSSQDVN